MSNPGRTQRGPGEDSVYRDGNRWRGAISIGRDAEGRRRRIKVSGKTKAEVIQRLREVHRALDIGASESSRQMTVGGFLDDWVATLDARVEASTAASYADTVRLHLRPALGTRPLTKLTVAEVNALWTAKRAAGYRPNSIRVMRTVLRAALRQAEREGHVVRNVAALSDPPRVGDTSGRSLTVDEAQRFLNAIIGDRLEAAYIVTLVLGLRRGEVLGLAWSDVDLRRHQLTVRQQVRRVRTVESGTNQARWELRLQPLKTKRSRRVLHLTDVLEEQLCEHRARQAAERAAAKSDVSTDLVFTSTVGTAIDPDNFGHAFQRICRRAGLGHWHIHELRHSAASIMLAQGTPLWVVSEVLGHASIAVTKDVYGHLISGEVEAATQAISDALFGETRAPESA